MGTFTSGFWTLWITALTLGGMAFCLLLLLALSRRGPGKPVDPATITGHVWDGDLAELNNPLPRWWLSLFCISIVFGLGYLALFPGLGDWEGLLHWTSAGQYQSEQGAAELALKPELDRYAAMNLVQVAGDPVAHGMGQRLFLNHCAPCHGSDGGGQRGFPNLRDQDWLYGGDPATIEQTILQGRQGQMPAWGAVLGKDGVQQVVHYVLSLSGSRHDPALAALGQPRFAAICAGCHGPDGKGNVAVGAPNLTDHIWLYGGTKADLIETVTNGRHGQMPAQQDRLGPARVHLLAAYVYGLSR